MKRMRDEVAFDGLKALKQQLQQDEINARSYLDTVQDPYVSN
jgi:FAD synthase